MTLPLGSLLTGANAVQYQTVTEGVFDGGGQATANAVALTAASSAICLTAAPWAWSQSRTRRRP